MTLTKAVSVVKMDITYKKMSTIFGLASTMNFVMRL